MDSFRLHQRIRGESAFKTPLEKVLATPAFKFRDTATREFTVNSVLLCSGVVVSRNWPEALRRPVFDVDRVESAADPLARIVVRGALGRFSLDIDPLLEVDSPELRVGRAVEAIRAVGESPAWDRLERLFAADCDHLGLLELIAAAVQDGGRPSQGAAHDITAQLEVWAYRTTRAVENLVGLRSWYRDHFSRRHTARTSCARLERTLPRVDFETRVEAWRKSAALLHAAAEALRSSGALPRTSLKVAVLRACENPRCAITPGTMLSTFLQRAFDEAVVSVCCAGRGVGRYAHLDRQAVFDFFGGSASTRAQQMSFGSLYQVVRGLQAPAQLPEVEFVETVRERTTRDLAATLRDWLGFSDPETVSINLFDRHA